MPVFPTCVGVFLSVRRRRGLSPVFPTCVGVFLFEALLVRVEGSLPHVRGGVSRHFRNSRELFPVFPTCVGVFLIHANLLYAARCLPHVRGGVSVPDPRFQRQGTSSPRAWGCFCFRTQPLHDWTVFPTCVGVFLPALREHAHVTGLPHVRGGVSNTNPDEYITAESSPRAWGCFLSVVHAGRFPAVFPTCVGVFPEHCACGRWSTGLPHVRGGVSPPRSGRRHGDESSPRAWGCFRAPESSARHADVFPTCVGVFPSGNRRASAPESLPHVRGGVSALQKAQLDMQMSSPRAWGCFSLLGKLELPERVFPTCVGVFLGRHSRIASFFGLPHVRGGVSKP